jgi:hypothetical protein
MFDTKQLEKDKEIHFQNHKYVKSTIIPLLIPEFPLSPFLYTR